MVECMYVIYFDTVAITVRHLVGSVSAKVDITYCTALFNSRVSYGGDAVQVMLASPLSSHCAGSISSSRMRAMRVSGLVSAHSIVVIRPLMCLDVCMGDSTINEFAYLQKKL